jgi:DNA repair protein RecN (Recombination protein N)
VLEELLIRDVGVIDEVTLHLAPGLNVLTGETGAGKTIVVSALELLLGARADADLVRAGAQIAVVEGRFHPVPTGAGEWLANGDEELVASRELVAGGRSRARLGGRLAPASVLADVVGAAVEVHGQTDSTRLLDPSTQRELLDRVAGQSSAGAFERYQDLYRRWRAAAAELASLCTDARDRARELDRLAFELAEIDAVGPMPGEEDALAIELARLEHAETLADAAAQASASVGGDGGARDALGGAVAVLRAVARLDPELDAFGERVEGLAAEAQDLALELTTYAESVELDPRQLEALRERRAALAGLMRKYGPDSAAVVAYADEARARLAALRAGNDRSTALAAEVSRLEAEVAAAARDLQRRRREAGDQLAAAVAVHLADLGMPAARMEVVVDEAEPGPNGGDRVRFLLAANAGEPALPLAKAASGGERSRIALAIRLALAGADDTAVLVFDEIDAGVGGATALAMGRKLATLACDRQVLCVTHLAQLAAFADAHFVVEKRTVGGRTAAAVTRLDDESRVRELSRMLSGTPSSVQAAGHAAELLSVARGQGSTTGLSVRSTSEGTPG